jgi:hypothetical protein
MTTTVTLGSTSRHKPQGWTLADFLLKRPDRVLLILAGTREPFIASDETMKTDTAGAVLTI